MKRKCYSYLEMKLNGQFIGYSSVSYHYNDFRNIISVEILPYPVIHKIPSIILKDEWATHAEDFLNVLNPRQDEHLTSRLLSGFITNFNSYVSTFEKRRETFNLDINVNGIIHPCFLVHEFHLTPPFKQVQILSDGRIYKFPINKPDGEIQDWVAHEILENG